MRYGGCLAPHSYLRGAIIPTPRQQGVEDEETDTGSPRAPASAHRAVVASAVGLTVVPEQFP